MGFTLIPHQGTLLLVYNEKFSEFQVGLLLLYLSQGGVETDLTGS